MSTGRFCSLIVIGVLALQICPAAAQADPNTRVLRLTLAQGDVQVDPNTGVGWQQAINNMPVTGGSRIWAAPDSRAEIEWEDGSSIRLLGPAEIVLDQLSLAADGAPVNRVEVDSGSVYINAELTAHADFRIQDPNGRTFAITQPSHLRFQVGERQASLYVVDGQVRAPDIAGNPVIRGGQSYRYSVAPQ